MKVLLIDQIAKVNYKYSFSLANALKRRGAEVDFVIDQKEDTKECDCKCISMFNTDEKNISKISKAINYISSMRKICKMMKEEYDTLHTQWIIFSPVDWFYLRKVKKMQKKLVVTIHDILPFNRKFYDYYFHQKIYAMADEIIVQAPDNLARFHKLFPENQVPVHMIEHGHFLKYADNCEKEEARRRLKIDQDRFVYLFFGQIKTVKGVDYLLKAYAKLLARNPQMKEKTLLVIAGSVWKADFASCEEIIQKEKMGDNLKLDIRYIPDEEVGVFYSAADVCVLPYLEVYQSGVLQLTYAYHKVPVVTDIPAFADIVTEERGVLCKPRDEESLFEAMYRAYEMRENLQHMAEKGYAYIEKRFNWDEIGKQIVELY